MPTQSFRSHRLTLDVSLFLEYAAFRATLKSLMPLFVFVNGMEDHVGYGMPIEENANFTEYRRGVLRGNDSDMVLREYTD